MIGAGVRMVPEHTELFERLVNVINEVAPGISFCFNTSPESTSKRYADGWTPTEVPVQCDAALKATSPRGGVFDEKRSTVWAENSMSSMSPRRARRRSTGSRCATVRHCGSDLHAKDHADELEDVLAALSYPDFMRGDTPVVMATSSAARSPSADAGSPRSSR